MAEFAAAALTTLATTAGTTAAASGTTAAITAGGASVASAAGAVAGTGSILGSFGTMSTVASILAGTATVASVLAAQRAGEEKAAGFEAAASDADTESLIAANEGTERRTSLRRQLLVAVGERDVAAAASGLDLSFGTPAQARREAIEDSERALETDGQNETLRRARLAERAGNYRRMAENARGGALAKSASLVLGQTAQLARRG
jgi:hypothetical protein